jgi:hypothetical protein
MSGIEPVQEYNDLIKRHLLDAIHRGIVGGLPQPTMFGGKRMRNFVLPASTEYDYPSSLAVGHLGASQPDMLGGSFWDDFSKGGIRHLSKNKKGGFLIGKDGSGVRTQAMGGYIGMTGNPYNESGFGSPNTQLDNHPHFYSGGVISGAGIWDNFKSGFTQVGNALAPVAKEVFHSVVVPEGKEYLKQQIKDYKTGKGGSKSSAIIAKMIGNQRKGFDINAVNRPSGNAISYAKKAFKQKYDGKNPSDMWNTYKGEIKAQEAPKKRGRKPKATAKAPALIIESDSESDEDEPQNVVVSSQSPVVPYNPAKGIKGRKPRGRPPKKGAKGTADIRGFFGRGRDDILTGGDVLGDISKVGQAVLPFLPLLMGLGRGDQMPPHPCGGNWTDDLANISKSIAPFAPLLMGLGRGKMPSKIAINKIIKSGGNWADDLGNIGKAILPFAPLLMGLGRGGSFIDDLGKVSGAIAPFIPLLRGLGRPKKMKGGDILGDLEKIVSPLLSGLGRGGSLSGKAVRRAPSVGADGHGILNFAPVVAKPVGSGRKKKGGVMIMDDPSQFQVNTGLMPPALASYNPPVPKTTGSGRKPKSGEKRVSARGAIVAKIMREKGLNLPQASKYVKDHGLY